MKTTDTPYPPHTPPAAPEGMRWEYRGEAWDPRREVTYYIGSGKPFCLTRTPNGCKGLHYFEAVPDQGHCRATIPESTEPPYTDEELMGTPHDPKGSAGSKKAPLCLLPSFPLHETSWVLKSGSLKYGKFNWRENKVCASTYRSAIQRHLDQWFDDLEDADHESGRSHLAHVIASACILMDAAKHGTLVDDRPQKPE